MTSDASDVGSWNNNSIIIILGGEPEKNTSYISEIKSAKMVIKDSVENIMHKPSSQDFHMRRSMRGMEEHETSYKVMFPSTKSTIHLPAARV